MKRLRLGLLVLVLLCALAAYYYHAENAVRVETIQLTSRLTGRAMPYDVVLPPGYGLVTSRGTRYPVLYLLHGWGGHHDSWIKNTNLKQYAAEHRLIIVTPEGENGWYTDGAGDTANKFESYFLEELMPDVDRRFRTITERRGRGLAGLSMGGYGSMKFALKRPELFAFAASTSGALDAASRTDDASIMQTFGEPGSATRTENDLPRLARDFPEERKGLLPFLYLDCGEKDLWFAANRDFAAILFERKLAYEYRQAPGDHVWPYWNKQLQEIMRAATEMLATPED
ncbi:MAG TPA: alpha/beta hydrolase family protein [Pyrinomonadaceae bacterium]|jgi:S-formylglutathione hydrolase FrmB|nr:alpha/beta hydrolase family protein [Pyrinomonadaceae bacterium]